MAISVQLAEKNGAGGKTQQGPRKGGELRPHTRSSAKRKRANQESGGKKGGFNMAFRKQKLPRSGIVPSRG